MRRTRNAVVSAVILLVALGVSARDGRAQTWKELLRNAAQDAVDEAAAGDAGRIREVRVVSRAPSEITVAVRLAGVTAPEEVGLKAQLLDTKGNPIPDVVVKHGAIPEGDGSVRATVRYTGTEKVHSSILLVQLVGPGGTVFSRKSTIVARSWEGLGAGASRPSPMPAPTPRVVRLQPVPVGDTPTGIAPGGAGGLQLRPPALRPGMQPARPTPQPTAAAVRPGPNLTLSRAVTARATLVDLYRVASTGTWTNGSDRLPFNGSNRDRRGFVRALGRHELNDGKQYERVLETHPAWKAHGSIRGDIPVALPRGARRIAATVGFLPGAGGSDGVTAQIFIRKRKQGSPPVRLWSRKVSPSEKPVAVSVPLPADFAGESAVLTLKVLAGASSARDWFAWSGLRVTN